MHHEPFIHPAEPAEPAGLPRRRFLQLLQTAGTLGATGGLGAAGLLAGAEPAAAQTAGPTPGLLEGYAGQPSVRAGQSLALHVRDPAAAAAAPTLASWRIVRLAGTVDLTMQTGSVLLRNHPVPADAASAGCGWPVALQLPIPADWPSGVYYAHFAAAAGNWCSVPFVVRPRAGAAPQRVLVVVPVSTAQAKNAYGGKSLYDRNSSGGQRAARVSFARPLERWAFGFDPWQPLLARWLQRRGIRADFCTDLDVHDEPALLTGPTLLVVAGHHAYWTREARTAFEAAVGAGLNAALLAGQTMCWQSRLALQAGGSRVLVCHKDAASDPDARAAYKTVRWAELSPAEPENRITGLGSAGTLTWPNAAGQPAAQGLIAAPHWVFDNTGLKVGQRFSTNIVGPFTDAALAPLQGTRLGYQDPQGLYYKLPFSSGANGTPVGTTLLAEFDVSSWQPRAEALPPTNGAKAHMAIYSRNGGAGTVFNAGTSDWVRGLASELAGQAPGPVSVITANVVGRLSAGGHHESADVRSWNAPASISVLTVESQPPALSRAFGGDTGVVLFRAFVGPVPGAVPVYRYNAPPQDGPFGRQGYRYLLSLKSTYGNGWSADGIAFWAFPTAVPGSEPIYRFHDVLQATGTYFVQYTTDRQWPYGILDEIAFHAPKI